MKKKILTITLDTKNLPKEDTFNYINSVKKTVDSMLRSTSDVDVVIGGVSENSPAPLTFSVVDIDTDELVTVNDEYFLVKINHR